MGAFFMEAPLKFKKGENTMTYAATVVTNTTLVKEIIKAQTNKAATALGKLAAASLTFVHSATVADTITAASGLDGFKKDTKIKIVGSVSNDGVYTIGTTDPTGTTITLIVTDVLVSEGPTTSVEIFGIEEFVITPTRGNQKICLDIFYTTDTGLTFILKKGQFWAAVKDLTGAVTVAVHNLLYVETARYLRYDGTMILQLIPVINKALLSDHVAEVGLVELPH